MRWVFTLAMLGVVGFHLLRLLRARTATRGAPIADHLTHAAMGTAMGAMLVGVVAPAGGGYLAALFALPLLWFLWRGVYGFVMDGARAIAPSARHVVGCAAMVYMLAIVATGSANGSAGSAMPGMDMAMPTSASLASPAVTAALVVATLVIAGWTVSGQRFAAPVATPALAAGCQVAMSTATVYMLVAM